MTAAEAPRIPRHRYLDEFKPNSLGFVGNSETMKRIYHIIEQVGPKKVTVNILGESGTGKELVARALHKLSGRPHMLAMNCGALPESLLESLLFGIRSGVATGVKASKGFIEASHGGTLFLDEIAETSHRMQVDLLRVLENGEITRVGDHATIIKVDLRLITASSKNLELSVKNGKLRDDFYHRIGVVPIVLPPLRNRIEDIVSLARYFCGMYSIKHDKEIYLGDSAYNILMNYLWPGNVRELDKAIERAVVMCEDENRYLSSEDLKFLDMNKGNAEDMSFKPCKFRDEVEGFERGLIIKALAASRGNITEASISLNISRQHLSQMCRRYEVNPDNYKPR